MMVIFPLSFFFFFLRRRHYNVECESSPALSLINDRETLAHCCLCFTLFLLILLSFFFTVMSASERKHRLGEKKDLVTNAFNSLSLFRLSPTNG